MSLPHVAPWNGRSKPTRALRPAQLIKRKRMASPSLQRVACPSPALRRARGAGDAALDSVPAIVTKVLLR